MLYLNANRLGFHVTKIDDFKKADFVLEIRYEWLETAIIQRLIDELKAQNALNAVYENKYFTLYAIKYVLFILAFWISYGRLK